MSEIVNLKSKFRSVCRRRKRKFCGNQHLKINTRKVAIDEDIRDNNGQQMARPVADAEAEQPDDDDTYRF